MRQMMQLVSEQFCRLDLLILNASGGLEKDKAADYAMQLNLTAQVRAVDLALPLMPAGWTYCFCHQSPSSLLWSQASPSSL